MLAYNYIGGIMSKDGFKTFVKNNPSLVDYVKNNEMTWQKFYEMYDLYGEEHDIWNNYLNKNSNNNLQSGNIMDNLKSVFDLFKGVDLKTVQKTLTGLDKAIGTFKEFSSSNTNNVTNSYESRPQDRYYED